MQIKEQVAINCHPWNSVRNGLDLTLELIKWILETITFSADHLGPVIDTICTEDLSRVVYEHQHGYAVVPQDKPVDNEMIAQAIRAMKL
jgi:hypothetical protein